MFVWSSGCVNFCWKLVDLNLQAGINFNFMENYFLFLIWIKKHSWHFDKSWCEESAEHGKGGGGRFVSDQPKPKTNLTKNEFDQLIIELMPHHLAFHWLANPCLPKCLSGPNKVVFRFMEKCLRTGQTALNLPFWSLDLTVWAPTGFQMP